MEKPTSAARWVARALTCILWVVGSAYLMKTETDPVVIASAPFVWAAVITLPILVHHALRDRQIIAAALLALAAVVGAGYTLQGTIARQSEARDARVVAANNAAKARSDTETKKRQAEAMLAEAQRDYLRECKTGLGSKCKGIRATVEVYEAAVKGHVADIAKVGKVETPQAGEQRIAAALAFVHGGTAADYADGVALFTPALFGLFCELAAMATAMFGWHNRRATRQPSQAPVFPRATVAATVVPVASNDPEPLPPKPGNRRRIATKAAAEADVIRLVARGEPIPSQDTLADRWGVHKGTASKWVRDFEARSLIRRQVVGRCKMVAAA